MEAEREKFIETLSLTALAFDLRERAEYLKKACGGDVTLQAEVESRITQYETGMTSDLPPEYCQTVPAGTGDAAATPAPEPFLPIDRHIGNYRMIEPLGKGGMGSVYLAERDDEQFKKLVAIKLINRGMATEFVLKRFLSERQILANLDHPFVGRLLDGGATPDGLPYLVMEYIEGMPVTKYCDEKQLPVNDRLKLFRKICEAVHYAHQNLVIHRDIKPSNILIAADGTPKLVDFGIAKLLHPGGAGSPDVTIAGARMMTPEYASPEQVRGEPITTASDVYSLGVLLYELLTGHRPYTFKKRTLDEVMRVVCEENPEKPSLAVGQTVEMLRLEGETRITVTPASVSSERATRPDKLRRELEGDLDNIVLMAMRKEPQRRYSSVAEFANDINRYLAGLPVAARRDTFSYRAQKFIRRNRIGVAAAVLIALTLIAGIIATLREAQIARREKARAEKRFQDVRALANSFMFEIHDAIQNLPGATQARESLVNKALTYLDSLSRESGNDESLQRELATAYEKVGAIQGDPAYANLGDIAGALASYRKALAIRESVAAKSPANTDVQLELADGYSRLGGMLEVNQDLAGALTAHHKALGIYEANPADREVQLNTSWTYEYIARVTEKTGDHAAGLELFRKALAMRQELVKRNPDDAKIKRALALLYQDMAPCLISNGATAEALESSRKGVTIFEALSLAEPTNAKAKRELALGYNRLGDAFWYGGDLTNALDNYRKGLKMRASLVAADPANVQGQRDLAVACGNLGYTEAQTGAIAEGLDEEKKAAAIFEKQLEANPGNEGATRDLAFAYQYLGEIYTWAGEKKSAAISARIEFYYQAKLAYDRSRKLYLEMRDKGTIRKNDDNPENLAQEIAKCDAAIAKLKR